MPRIQYEEPKAANKLQPGTYLFKVADATLEISKSGNEMIKLSLEHESGFKLSDWLVFTKKAEWKINLFLKAFHIAANHGDFVDVVPENLIGEQGYVEIEQNGDFMRVAAYVTKEEEKDNANQDELPF